MIDILSIYFLIPRLMLHRRGTVSHSDDTNTIRSIPVIGRESRFPLNIYLTL